VKPPFSPILDPTAIGIKSPVHAPGGRNSCHSARQTSETRFACSALWLGGSANSLSSLGKLGLTRVNNEQALVWLSSREFVDASRGCTCHCKMANNRFFSLIVSA